MNGTSYLPPPPEYAEISILPDSGLLISVPVRLKGVAEIQEVVQRAVLKATEQYRRKILTMEKALDAKRHACEEIAKGLQCGKTGGMTFTAPPESGQNAAGSEWGTLDTLWTIPNFWDIELELARMQSRPARFFGTINGEKVILNCTGRVKMISEYSSFGGKCLIEEDDWAVMDCYCLGEIDGTSTAILLRSDGGLFAYDPPFAARDRWTWLEETCTTAEVTRGDDGDLVIHLRPEIQIVSLNA
jgi:hypothetical protein